mmetsp:Transcript_14045/g.41847  ORF Transcript_14045/g.41847 Transcript_14045/m.41847 type:complete len:286 (-) Transcript_14045:51-908(-)
MSKSMICSSNCWTSATVGKRNNPRVHAALRLAATTVVMSSMSSPRMLLIIGPKSLGKPKRHINATMGSVALQGSYSTACSKQKGEDKYALPGSMGASCRCAGAHTDSSHTFFPLETVSFAGKTPERSLRAPPRVRPRCTRLVAPSMWEGCRSLSPPQRICASTTPKCRLFLKHSMKVPNRRPLPSLLYSSSPCSRARLSARRASMTTDQHGWLMARKAIINARMRGGARMIRLPCAWRGTKKSSSVLRCGTACQSAFRSFSSSSDSKLHLVQGSSILMGMQGGHS